MAIFSGIKRGIFGWALLAVFVAFPVIANLHVNPLQEENLIEETRFSEEPSFAISSYRSTSGNENTQTFGAKLLNFPGATQVQYCAHPGSFVDPIISSVGISRFLCHVFYVFISSKAP